MGTQHSALSASELPWAPSPMTLPPGLVFSGDNARSHSSQLGGTQWRATQPEMARKDSTVLRAGHQLRGPLTELICTQPRPEGEPGTSPLSLLSVAWH